MKSTPITNQSAPEIVSTSANTAGVISPIFTVTVPDGAIYDLPNNTQVRGATVRGCAIIADLRNSDGNRIRSGSLLVGSRGPADEFEQNHRAIPLSTWADLSTADQRNENFRANIAAGADLNTGDVLVLPRKYKLVVSLKSAEVIDWSKSYLEFPFVEENK